MDKKRKGLYGNHRVVRYEEYTDHLKDMTSGLGANKTYVESKTGDGEIAQRQTLEFDDDVVSKINFADLFDNLDRDEELDSIQEYRYETLDVNQKGLTDVEKRRVENIVGRKRKIPISESEYSSYHSHMKQTAWDIQDPWVQEKIQRDWREVQAFKAVRRTAPSATATATATTKSSSPQPRITRTCGCSSPSLCSHTTLQHQGKKSNNGGVNVTPAFKQTVFF